MLGARNEGTAEPRASGYTHCVMGDSGEEAAGPASGARLEAVSGPLKGKLFPLTGDEVSIGRDPSNEISLLDSLVSRRHCVIRKEANAFRLQDLESRNNTFVSGVPSHGSGAGPRGPDPGGQLDPHLPGPRSSESIPGNASLQLDATPVPGAATVILRKEDARYLQPSRPDGLPATAKTVRDLNVLLEFSRTLNSVRGLAALQEKVLEAVLEIVPADQAAILID